MWPEGMQKISMHAHECNDETDFYPDSQKKKKSCMYHVMAFYAITHFYSGVQYLYVYIYISFFQYFTGDYSVDCVIAL